MATRAIGLWVLALVLGASLLVIGALALRRQGSNEPADQRYVSVRFSIRSRNFVNYFLAVSSAGSFTVPLVYGPTIRKAFMEHTKVVRDVLDPIRGCEGGTDISESVPVPDSEVRVFVAVREVIDGAFGEWSLHPIDTANPPQSIQPGIDANAGSISDALRALKVAQREYTTIKDAQR
jgi:hypothetical protein